MKENYELIDNEERHQYEFHIERYVPRIEYIKNKDGVIYLTHTEVPMELGGKGIGSQLVEKVLRILKIFLMMWICSHPNFEKKDLRLVPLCPFVAGYIQKHPDWKRIVMRGIHV